MSVFWKYEIISSLDCLKFNGAERSLASAWIHSEETNNKE
jgi:hypothetical protein